MYSAFQVHVKVGTEYGYCSAQFAIAKATRSSPMGRMCSVHLCRTMRKLRNRAEEITLLTKKSTERPKDREARPGVAKIAT